MRMDLDTIDGSYLYSILYANLPIIIFYFCMRYFTIHFFLLSIIF